MVFLQLLRSEGRTEISIGAVKECEDSRFPFLGNLPIASLATVQMDQSGQSTFSEPFLQPSEVAGGDGKRHRRFLLGD